MIKIAGITAEYNPFHEGHAYHIRKTREAAGEDAVIACVMSGDFVQRGEWAVFPKKERAAAAVRGGADLVFELPLPWCISSAERFAGGAVQLLSGIGASRISFGSETGDIDALAAIAARAASPNFAAELAECRKAHPERTDAQCRAGLLGLGESFGPNDTLGIEYLKAMQGSGIEPIAVQRVGNGHDQTGEKGFPSASELRRRIRAGESDGNAVNEEKLELALISRLRMLSKESFSAAPDCGGGLGNRICDAVREEMTLNGIYALAKTKRYSLSAVRRAVLCAALGIRQEDVSGSPPYARLLAASAEGCRALAELRGRTEIPIVGRTRDLNGLDERAKRIFTLGSSAHDLYLLGLPGASKRCGEDVRSTPYIFPERDL